MTNGSVHRYVSMLCANIAAFTLLTQNQSLRPKCLIPRAEIIQAISNGVLFVPTVTEDER